ncbi:hypothetical protein EJ04DRAFT_576931 [Polyplosphaeria fusca]|uniref:Uncharacterized protein n=1 Tax=Polyplosphaeria fusca TaxID=682080 RepID=A0A9P4V1D1_9PLEO|nr:hypothetical protein EJ04DRAFT_576931 [Polyplosphaeria fusca]
MNSFLESLPESNYRRSLAFTSLPESYYMTRQLVLTYHNPPLPSTLRSKLEAAPKATLRTHHEMSLFMCEYLDDEEQSLQGIAKDKEDQTIDDELYANAVKEEWQFALDVTSQALEQRLAKPSSHVV